MCGITALISSGRDKITSLRNKMLNLSKKIRHRGPDWNGIHMSDNVIICHERLSIVGVEHGSQPIEDPPDNDNCNYVLSVNGEIYNYKELYTSVLHGKYKPETQSDCEIIIHLYKEFGEKCVKMLDGVFSFILYDRISDKILVARDPIGVVPLYYGITKNNDIMFSSEMKVLQDDCPTILTFKPGHLLNLSIINYQNSNKLLSCENSSKLVMHSIELTNYYNPHWDNEEFNHKIQEEILCKQIRDSLTSAVRKRLMAEVPWGVLLSGGLDSSLVASISNRLLKTTKTPWGNKLHTFSIGLKDAPDLISARKVAVHLGTIHHEYNFTVQEGIDSIDELIYQLETYDVTTIRASTPMYLMSRKIKSLGIKMVLSGEGADEILGGYLYFHNAPNNLEFHKECVRRVKGLHNFDCLRANKSTMSWGLEARVPFLDKSFLELSVPIHPEHKINKIEKYILRKAFSVEEGGEKYLPDDILWRQKEQFSDGVGYNWVDGLKEFIEKQISDEEFSEFIKDFNGDDVPKNKEELYYRRIFDRHFPGRDSIVPRWIPKMDWDGVEYDPSGRVQKAHNN